MNLRQTPYKYHEFLLVIDVCKSHLGKNLTDCFLKQSSKRLLSSKYLKSKSKYLKIIGHSQF